MKDMKKINIFFNFVLLLTFFLKNNQKTYFADMPQLSQRRRLSGIDRWTNATNVNNTFLINIKLISFYLAEIVLSQSVVL